jgi:nicotinamide riboside kinase
MSPCLVVAIVGAESTGKSTLALALRDTLAADGTRVASVSEALRDFCDAHARTPRRHEQAGIAAEQSARIEAAAQSHAIVVADTTALMIAVYSDIVFGDRSLYDSAQRAQAGYGLTLLTALDLPWVADGLQRDGAQVRVPVDALLREALQRHVKGYSVISGQGPARTAAALAAVRGVQAQSLHAADTATATAPRWKHVCERCGDPDCERHLLPGTGG